MSGQMAPRLRAVSAPGVGAAVEVFQPRLPGIGARYLSSLADAARTHGWQPAEITGLLAAAETRSTLWVVSGRRVPPGSTVVRWQAGALIPTGDVGRLLDVIGAAESHGAVCLAAISGPTPARLVEQFAGAGARLGRASARDAVPRSARWSVEVLRTPVLLEDSMPALREQLASAPRCGWCRMPVLGTACRRCLEDAR